jgi:hypothetical protein
VTVDTIEASNQSSSPRELIAITHGATTYRIATGTRDVMYDNQIYTATAAARGEIGVPPVDDANVECEITLPIDHAFVRRYLKQLMPPLSIACTIRRLYYPGGETEQIWSGPITSMSCDDDDTLATFRSPSFASEAAVRKLPTISVGRTCPHILYGAGCNVDRNNVLFKVTTTVISVNGRDVHVDIGSLSADHWSDGGEIVHVATGDRMTIREQLYINNPPSSVVTLSLQDRMPDLKIGDSVEVYAGCDHIITTCHGKFDNRENFGGYPQLPSDNPFKWER